MGQSLQGNQDKLKENFQILSIFMDKLHTEFMERGLLKRLWNKLLLYYVYTPGFLSSINKLYKKLVKAIHYTHMLTNTQYVYVCLYKYIYNLLLYDCQDIHVE